MELIIGQADNNIVYNEDKYNDLPPKDMRPEPCRRCSNNPDNGGSGICNCILGLAVIKC